MGPIVDWTSNGSACNPIDDAALSAGLPLSRVGWRVVWCYERCHKQESVAQREKIRMATKACDATLICLKKAKQFAEWTERGPRPPFMLVADWREAKPCIKVICSPECQSKPILTVVVCTSQQQHSRASTWAQTLPPSAGCVHICEHSSVPQNPLAVFLEKFFTTPSSQVQAALVDTQHPGSGGESSSASQQSSGISDDPVYVTPMQDLSGEENAEYEKDMNNLDYLSYVSSRNAASLVRSLQNANDPLKPGLVGLGGMDYFQEQNAQDHPDQWIFQEPKLQRLQDTQDCWTRFSQLNIKSMDSNFPQFLQTRLPTPNLEALAVSATRWSSFTASAAWSP
jgi:hypothetical protein